MRHRALFFASLLTAATATFFGAHERGLGPRSAEASVSILVSLDELLLASSYVVVGTAGERKSVWEDLPSGKRIVTYTKIKVDESLVGAPGKEVTVRTLGGVVGDVGQAVSGEAQIAAGSKSVLFLMKSGDTVVVAAMAQGHYPVKTDENGKTTLRASPDTGTQIQTPGPTVTARDQLVGKSLDTAKASIAAAKKALEAKREEKK